MIVPAKCQERETCPECDTPLRIISRKNRYDKNFAEVLSDFDHYTDMQKHLRNTVGKATDFLLFCPKCRKSFFIEWDFLGLPIAMTDRNFMLKKFKPKVFYAGDTDEEVKTACDLLKSN